MKPVIFGCAGPVLSEGERAFFEAQQPAGFILFARNIVSPSQVKELTADLLRCVKKSDVLIGVDQEGGRVQRLGPPHWRQYPPMAIFGACAAKDSLLAENALEDTCRIIADDLARVGFNMICAPVLDVPVQGADNIIGDRAFSQDPKIVKELGRVALYSFQANGLLPVIKHMPGHGRALVDSHKALPKVTEPIAELVDTDFYPFQKLRHCPLAMTAHIVFEAVDAARPLTLSAKAIQQIIRQEIGFKGLLMTDDLSMSALEGDVSSRADAALKAGCDLVLHCNGDIHEMREIAAAIPRADPDLQRKIVDLVRPVRIMSASDRIELETAYEQRIADVERMIEG